MRAWMLRWWVYWPAVGVVLLGFVGWIFGPPWVGHLGAILGFAVYTLATSFAMKRTITNYEQADRDQMEAGRRAVAQATVFQRHWTAVVRELDQQNPAVAREARQALAHDLASMASRRKDA